MGLNTLLPRFREQPTARRCHRRVRVHRPPHCPPPAVCGPPGEHPHLPSGEWPPFWKTVWRPCPGAGTTRRPLARQLEGVDTLYNTYWVRFDHGEQTHARAVANSRTLMDAARRCRYPPGRPRQHCPRRQPLAAALLPRQRAGGGGGGGLRPLLRYHPAYAGVRRYVDILVNNIAWFLRRGCR